MANILQSINDKLGTIEDVEFKAQIEKLMKDYIKKTSRMEKIMSISDKQQMELLKLNEKVEESYKKLKIASETDSLTSINNRVRCEKVLKENIDANISYSVMIIDTDNFKIINQKHDLIVGNQVLVEMSKLLRRLVGSKSLLGRWSGDTFLVIDSSLSLDDMIEKAQDICDSVEEHFFNDVGKITVSIGVASTQHSKSFELLVSTFEHALIKAKNNGKNQVSI